jgi:hypothetical protein
MQTSKQIARYNDSVTYSLSEPKSSKLMTCYDHIQRMVHKEYITLCWKHRTWIRCSNATILVQDLQNSMDEGQRAIAFQPPNMQVLWLSLGVLSSWNRSLVRNWYSNVAITSGGQSKMGYGLQVHYFILLRISDSLWCTAIIAKSTWQDWWGFSETYRMILLRWIAVSWRIYLLKVPTVVKLFQIQQRSCYLATCRKLRADACLRC